ncbi:hypothetical protein N7510_010292 [Penicillium lagena]|uniref:uncharacterized protein n=1 Tax=Penicillium lagena TaxID=94218 RepID=UPI00254167F5|nr:uncharacterized protein N7510_010292 [Penicillium lagena]KAJ5605138.1 hypothetical protein N7510_010292 [Penicillium lagena]
MRFHLVISRHGLPVTRILWTTTSPASATGGYGTQTAASTSAISSARNPNIAFANGGYTVAQLLEDVNEVVPLETGPSLFDAESSGQWGLEDYVVEIGGSECLHFMEVEGLFREGDEVIIRALQLSDLRARRLCGRHQISNDGKHLIDGVPFGSPYLRRTTSARPVINIPPRKKRRTVFSGWESDHAPQYLPHEIHTDADEESADRDWRPAGESSFGKELSVIPAEHESSDMGTVIRHPIHDDDESDRDSDFNEEELENELQALKEDFEGPASQFSNVESQDRPVSGHALRSSSASKRPSSAETQRRSSLRPTSSLSNKQFHGEDTSPRTSKAVRFNGGGGTSSDLPQPNGATDRKSPISESSASSSSDSSDSSDADSSDEEDSDSDSSSDSDGSSSEASSSEESEGIEGTPPAKKARLSILNPPGHGSVRTRKSNTRYKLRRRLSKLKELGILSTDADFAALREWEQANGGWYLPVESSDVSRPLSKEQKKEQAEAEFEARRQKLLRDLAAGGVEVDGSSEKENVPPRQSVAVADEEVPANGKAAEERSPATRRTLDIASSRRMLFGSLGVRTPKNKEEDEAARRKFAAQASTVHSRKKKEEKPPIEEESESDIDWQEKLVIRATECVFEDVELSGPPFPFKQRWDADANAMIRELKGGGKKRKRKQRIQVYNNGGQEDEYDDGNAHYEAYFEGDHQLNYDDAEPEMTETDPKENVEDLPALPSDMTSLPHLEPSDVKVGVIIAFRQLDMSKATNWQPRMSEYRVAEVHEVGDHDMIKVRLAQRDRKPKPVEMDMDDEPRRYSGFEMPGYDDDEEEDDGFRELAFPELSDPKLLQPANLHGQEDSVLVSVVEDSMPSAQPASGLAGMDVDEDTLVTDSGQPLSPPNLAPPSEQPSAPPQTNGTDDRSQSSRVSSPAFLGFPLPLVEVHSSQRSISGHDPAEASMLDGQTLIGEAHLAPADSSNQEISFLSNGQSGELDAQVDDRGVVHPLEMQSSQVEYYDAALSASQAELGASQSSLRSRPWETSLRSLRNATDSEELGDEEDRDGLNLSPNPSTETKTTPSKRKSPPSGQKDTPTPSQRLPNLDVDSPAASTRSRSRRSLRSRESRNSQVQPSQASVEIDLTLSSSPPPGNSQQSQSQPNSNEDGGSQSSRRRTRTSGKVRRLSSG